MPGVGDVFAIAAADSRSKLPYLSLGMVLASARGYAGGVLSERYRIHPLIVACEEDGELQPIIRRVARADAPLCLFSSYVWNHRLNLELASAIAQANPRATILFGGPEVPKYPGETEHFLRANPFIDFAVLGEGEITLCELLRALLDDCGKSLQAVDGLVYRTALNIERTADRVRVRDLDLLPSPYLGGEFEPWFRDFPLAMLETNRGCPYGCTYCDWGSATLQKVSKFPLERVIAEIDYLASTRARVIFIADANFGMLEQDIAIAEALVAARRRTGFPTKVNTNFAKNGGRRLMQVIRILHEGGLLPVGIIALQTTDREVLEAIRRDNIKTRTYEQMMKYFSEAGIPMSTDIMIGLPGQTLESLVRDVQYCFDWKVSANGNFTSMMPNAPMAEPDYRKAYAIEADEHGLIVSTRSFTPADMGRMKSFFYTYQFMVRLGTIKYILYYCQLEHGVQATRVLQAWLAAVEAEDPALPVSRRLYREVLRPADRHSDWVLVSWGDEALFFFAGIDDFYREVFRLIRDTFGVSLRRDVETCLLLTQSAVMPRLEREYPFRVELPHDIVAYFAQIKSVPQLDDLGDDFRPLHGFGPAELVTRPHFRFKPGIRFTKVSGHMDDWELPSPLRFY